MYVNAGVSHHLTADGEDVDADRDADHTAIGVTEQPLTLRHDSLSYGVKCPDCGEYETACQCPDVSRHPGFH